MPEAPDRSLFRPALVYAAVLVTCAFLGFWCYGCQRTSSGLLPRTLNQKATCFAKSVVWIGVFGVVFVAPALLAVDVRRQRPLRRIESGLCEVCEYPQQSGFARCPECGNPASQPPAARGSRRHVIGLLIALRCGVAIGSLAAEVLLGRDERAFMIESKAAGANYTIRLRRGFFYGELYWSSGRYWTEDD
jgi:hypothetical protein